MLAVLGAGACRGPSASSPPPSPPPSGDRIPLRALIDAAYRPKPAFFAFYDLLK